MHVVIAGVPARFHDRLRGALSSVERGNQGFRPVVVPFSERQPQVYTSGYVRSIVSRLARDVSVCQQSQTCMVAYLDHASSDLLRAALHPFALLVVLLPPRGEELRRDREAQAVNRLAVELRRAFGQFRDTVKAIGDEVDSGRRNRTPLLLPRRNFDSGHLDQLLSNLACTLVPAGSQRAAQVAIKSAVSAFLRHHPLVRSENGRQAHSNGALLFNSPGKYMHGRQHSSDSHPDECRLGARIRLGHGFHKQFHYDTEPRRGSFAAVIPSCHGTFNVPHATTHVNIAPNDHARVSTE